MEFMCTGQDPSYAQKKTAGASKPWLNWLGLLVCIRNTSCWEVAQPLPHIFKKSSDLESQRDAAYPHKQTEERRVGFWHLQYCPIISVIITQPESWHPCGLRQLNIRLLCVSYKQQSEGIYNPQMTNARRHTQSVSPLHYSGQQQQIWTFRGKLSLCQLHTENKMRLAYFGWQLLEQLGSASHSRIRGQMCHLASLRLDTVPSDWPLNCQHVVIPGCDVSKATGIMF